MTGAFVTVAAAGLAVGWFLNLVISRVPQGRSPVRPGSRCPHCAAPIKPWHNVPVLGWLMLRGRCAACQETISPRYPLVEIATALLFVAVTARIGLVATLPAYLYLTAVTVALTMIDCAVHRLPNSIVLPSYLVGGVLLVPGGLAGHDWSAVVRGLAAMAVLWSFFRALVFVHPGGMGYGDVKLAGLLGLYLGWLGWSSVLVGTFAGFLIGGAVGAALLLTRRADRKTAIPFGPFMLGGAMLALFIAGPVAAWYTSLLAPA
jgi:leader peptidase (prepilin peptidase)/N-methyltransferase